MGENVPRAKPKHADNAREDKEYHNDCKARARNGCIAGGGIKRGFVFGQSDATASAPAENPVHPTELLATIYHAMGIHPATIVYNHLNQPRELVKADAVTELFG